VLEGAVERLLSLTDAGHEIAIPWISL